MAVAYENFLHLNWNSYILLLLLFNIERVRYVCTLTAQMSLHDHYNIADKERISIKENLGLTWVLDGEEHRLSPGSIPSQ